MIRKDYTDQNGIRRRALVPDEYTNAEEGLPASISLDAALLQQGCSFEYIKRLYAELQARGLIEPADFLKPQAPDLISAALRATIRMDVQTIQAIAKEQSNGK